MKIKAKSWEELKNFYESLICNNGWRIEPMLDLVKNIKGSTYVNAIYAYNSHAVLCIGQHENLDSQNAILRVEYHSDKNEMAFSYKGDNTLKYTWKKQLPESEAFQELERFLRELKWVM